MEHCDYLLPGDYFLALTAGSRVQVAVLEHCGCCLLPGDYFLALPAGSLVQVAVLEHCDCCLLPDDCFLALRADSPVQAAVPEHLADWRAVPDARLHCWSAEDWRRHGHHAPRVWPRLVVQT